MHDDPSEQIILRRKAPFRRTRTAGPLNAGPMGMANLPNLGEPVLEHAQMTPAQVADLQRDPEVQVIAGAMPLKLIEPVGGPESAPAAVGNTWGIEAVGAHTSPFTGQGVVVAVLDTGINPGHVAFLGRAVSTSQFHPRP